ncbi:TPA: hypothetical protein GDO54_018598 [Pyxicephalus adspersus]|uniref:Uncharacterized protein n=1 Tax=Pyxicephalus adspersus TaxID=30357 RepID=A0AAV2ZF19_PYXAD|nr:TPA: hypothetical protein GDO54_018598 [Pyxicephalus adspersus]
MTMTVLTILPDIFVLVIAAVISCIVTTVYYKISQNFFCLLQVMFILDMFTCQCLYFFNFVFFIILLGLYNDGKRLYFQCSLACYL